MLIVDKIDETEADSVLKDFLTSSEFLPIFFYSPYTLNTWLMHQGKKLYVAKFGDEKILILHKEKNNDIRFLFTEPSPALLKEVAHHFNPRYMAFNEVMDTEIKQPGDVEDQELVIDIDLVANLNDKEIRNKYNKCLKRHSDLTVQCYKSTDRDLVREFLEEWSHSRSEEKNKYAKTENDNCFLDKYAVSEDVLGIVVRDEGKVIAISFACLRLMDRLLE